MFRKTKKQILLFSAEILLCASTLESCIVVMGHHPPAISIDPVCGMKVDKSEAYSYKYKDKKYYFDAYNCKETFKMNPEKFLSDNCEEKK